jgi:hypothetical protein
MIVKVMESWWTDFDHHPSFRARSPSSRPTRPNLLGDIKVNSRSLIEGCWSRNAADRRRREVICQGLGSKEFTKGLAESEEVE